MLIPLAYKYGKHPEKMVSVENALNMQPEYAQDGRAELILRSCPGLTQFSAGNANGSASETEAPYDAAVGRD